MMTEIYMLVVLLIYASLIEEVACTRGQQTLNTVRRTLSTAPTKPAAIRSYTNQARDINHYPGSDATKSTAEKILKSADPNWLPHSKLINISSSGQRSYSISSELREWPRSWSGLTAASLSKTPNEATILWPPDKDTGNIHALDFHAYLRRSHPDHAQDSVAQSPLPSDLKISKIDEEPFPPTDMEAVNVQSLDFHGYLKKEHPDHAPGMEPTTNLSVDVHNASPSDLMITKTDKEPFPLADSEVVKVQSLDFLGHLQKPSRDLLLDTEPKSPKDVHNSLPSNLMISKIDDEPFSPSDSETNVRSLDFHGHLKKSDFDLNRDNEPKPLEGVHSTPPSDLMIDDAPLLLADTAAIRMQLLDFNDHLRDLQRGSEANLPADTQSPTPSVSTITKLDEEPIWSPDSELAKFHPLERHQGLYVDHATDTKQNPPEDTRNHPYPDLRRSIMNNIPRWSLDLEPQNIQLSDKHQETNSGTLHIDHAVESNKRYQSEGAVDSPYPDFRRSVINKVPRWSLDSEPANTLLLDQQGDSWKSYTNHAIPEKELNQPYPDFRRSVINKIPRLLPFDSKLANITSLDQPLTSKTLYDEHAGTNELDMTTIHKDSDKSPGSRNSRDVPSARSYSESNLRTETRDPSLPGMTSSVKDEVPRSPLDGNSTNIQLEKHDQSKKLYIDQVPDSKPNLSTTARNFLHTRLLNTNKIAEDPISWSSISSDSSDSR